MLYRATHITRYVYEQPVSQCLTEARLIPRSFDGQTLRESRIAVEPEPAVSGRRRDYFGNEVATFEVFQRHDRLTATATSLVEVVPRTASDLPPAPWDDARRLLVEHPDDASLAAYEFTFGSSFVTTNTTLAEYGRPTFTPGRPMAGAVLELAARIHAEFRYQPKSTSIDVPLTKVLKQREGVCQDFAHLMIGVLRSFGLAARYVSGYLRSRKEYLGAEASHAWVSVYIPGYGWLDIDPTNNVIPSGAHITLAWGRDYGDVSPVKGITLGGGGQTVQVEVRVEPVESGGTQAPRQAT